MTDLTELSPQQLNDIVRRVMAEVGAPPTGPAPGPDVDEAEIPDIRAVDYREVYLVPEPANPEPFARMKRRTWARLGQGRVGPRYTTVSQLRFWADQAAAMDAVSTDVSQEFLDRLGLFTIQTRCQSKEQFLTDPNVGAQFDADAIATITSRCQAKPQVQVFVADGLSSTAVEANVADLLPALEQGLTLHGLVVGTPFFVKYGRVRSMEPISEVLDATVTCVLIGERPGLASAESLSAYLAYNARVGMPEAERTCVSNIHESGTNAIEAGAHLADLIAEMMKQQASGIHLETS